MFYRLSGLLKLLADKFFPNLVYSLGLFIAVLFMVLVFRLFLLIVYRFIDTKPALGSLGILAGIAGLIYILLWASVLLKSLHYLNIEAVRNVISGSFSAKYILPLPLFIYKIIVGIGTKVFVLKVQS